MASMLFEKKEKTVLLLVTIVRKVQHHAPCSLSGRKGSETHVLGDREIKDEKEKERSNVSVISRKRCKF